MIKHYLVKYSDIELKYDNPIRQLEINIYPTYVMLRAHIRNKSSIEDR